MHSSLHFSIAQASKLYNRIMSEPKKLYRNTQDKVLGGVCSGIGDYFNLDPTLIRLIAVLLIVFSGGLGIFAYIFAWIIVPAKK